MIPETEPLVYWLLTLIYGLPVNYIIEFDYDSSIIPAATISLSLLKLIRNSDSSFSPMVIVPPRTPTMPAALCAQPFIDALYSKEDTVIYDSYVFLYTAP